MKTLFSFFFQGLLILLPFVLTIYLVFLIFTALNETVFSAVGSVIAHFAPTMEPGITATIIGTLGTLIAITLTGVAGSLYLTRHLMALVDNLMERIPVVKMLYNSLKDLFNALLGEKKSFDQPVLVYLTEDKAIKAMGFMTSDDLGQFGLHEDVAIYLPQSYNFAGNLIIVSRNRVEPLPAPAGQVTTFVVSGGVSTTDNKNQQ